MCVPFRSRDSWAKAINSKEFIKRSLGDDGFDQKTFQALPISWQYLYDYTCMLQTKVFCYYSWNTSLQLISCLAGFFLFKFTVFVFLKGSRVYPVRIQGTESVATIDWSFLPQKARGCPPQGFILERHQDLQGLILSASWVAQAHVSPHAPFLSKIIVTQGS